MKRKGTYLLVLHLPKSLHQLRIGQLGVYDFAPGYYVYVGSANGPGGLDGRLHHHLQRETRRPHWHIDYLRPHTNVVAVWKITCQKRLEDAWCQALSPLIQMPIRGFGASDSACVAHLFYSTHQPSVHVISQSLFASLSSDESVTVTIDLYTK